MPNASSNRVQIELGLHSVKQTLKQNARCTQYVYRAVHISRGHRYISYFICWSACCTAIYIPIINCMQCIYNSVAFKIYVLHFSEVIQKCFSVEWCLVQCNQSDPSKCQLAHQRWQEVQKSEMVGGLKIFCSGP